MGYTTDFNGTFIVSPTLKPEHKHYLFQFSKTRRMKRDSSIAESFADPVRNSCNLPIGIDGEFFVGCRGSGSGGQKRNKTESAVQIFHKPSGLIVRCETERSQKQNKETAIALLRAKLWEQKLKQEQNERSQNRKEQVGTGMRGDKRRTVRFQDGKVQDHITGKKWSLKEMEPQRLLEGKLVNYAI